ncbi:hypothetical protein SAY86_028848 [Trapa natans]|uniref:Uncharacterized protein n=1 Tax=Trapa natans TaxID=22666 RepID=A0AAN7MDI2_TRANT|nr:hypothetical protein SAY86_028848 [Trapa natans]
MGCFLACFGPSKDKKSGKQRPKIQVQLGERRAASVEPTQYIPVHAQEQNKTAEPVSSVTESRDTKPEEKVSCVARKKVTFDSNIRTYGHVSSHDEVPDSAPEIGENSNDGEKKNIIMENPTVSQSSSEDASYEAIVGSHNPNNRYQNCRESDDEDLCSDFDESDLEDDYDDGDELEDIDQIDRSRLNKVIMERSPTHHVQGAEESKSCARDRSAFVHSVLNPIENLTQWKAAKAKGSLPVKHQSHKEDSGFDKESRMISSGSEAGFGKGTLSFNRSSSREVSVDASLSNWLVSSESTPVDKKSSDSICSSPKSMCQGSNFRNHEDRPILGALTVEELRQFSAKNSPRKSPSRSPDEMTIIGTVGTYWNPSPGSPNSNSCHSASTFKGIPNTTSKYREDRKVNWHSTPFEARLERALTKGCADD